jgi:hypothetical protein
MSEKNFLTFNELFLIREKFFWASFFNVRKNFFSSFSPPPPPPPAKIFFSVGHHRFRKAIIADTPSQAKGASYAPGGERWNVPFNEATLMEHSIFHRMKIFLPLHE